MQGKTKSLFFQKISIPVALLILFFTQGISFGALQNKTPITRGEFIEMMAKNQPNNPFLPKGHSQISREQLYRQTATILSHKGFKVLEGKSMNKPLLDNEFVRLTYAFSGQPSGKNLFEQKMYLKKAGIIDSADIGLTTGLDGKVYQTHEDENTTNKAQLASPVFMKDFMETDFSSKAVFTFDDKSTLTMGEDSTVNINKHIYDPDKDLRQTIVKIKKGAIRFSVTKGKAPGSMFKVITPTAIAGVRGTEFVVIVKPDGNTTFIVLEGEIETRPIMPNGKEGRIAYISQGKEQEILKGGIATRVKTASKSLLETVAQKTASPQNLLKVQGVTKELTQNAIKQVAKVATNLDKTVKSILETDSILKTDNNIELQGGEIVSFAENTVNKTLNFTENQVTKILQTDALNTPKTAVHNLTSDVMQGVAIQSSTDIASQAINTAATEAATTAAREAATTAATEAATTAATEAAKTAATEAAKTAAIEAVKETAVEAAKSIAILGG